MQNKNEKEIDAEELRDQLDEILWITHAMNEGGNHYIVPVVYTLYGADDCVLYVGSSQGLIDRLDWHSRRPYWKDVKRIGIRVYPDREQMRIAELSQMFIKKPKYNRDGKYNDDKEILFFGVPGIKVTDNTEEIFYERNELFIGRTVEDAEDHTGDSLHHTEDFLHS